MSTDKEMATGHARILEKNTQMSAVLDADSELGHDEFEQHHGTSERADGVGCITDEKWETLMFEGRALHQLHVDDKLLKYLSPLPPATYAGLEASILAEGCRDPLVVWNELLIDGHNRHAICTKHGIPFTVVENNTFNDLDDVHLWMIDNQDNRRNHNDFLRTSMQLLKKDILAKKAKVNLATKTRAADSQPLSNLTKAAINTRNAIAKAAGVASGTVAAVEKIQAKAVPAVIAAVSSGVISIHAAAQVAALPQDEQEAAVAGGKESVDAAVKAAKQAKSDSAPKAGSAITPAAAGDTAWPFQSADDITAGEGQPDQPTATVEPLDPAAAELAELYEVIAELQAALKDALSDNEMMGRVFDADDKIKAAMDEAKRQKAIADSAENSYNAQQGKVVGLANQVTYWKKRAEKFEKALAKAPG